MAGYRTRLILGAQEFDTYGVLRDFARHPTTINHSRFTLLLDAVDTRYTWDCVINSKSPELYEQLKNLRSGAWLYRTVDTSKQVSLNADSTIDDYKKACAMAGFNFSQEDFDKLSNDK